MKYCVFGFKRHNPRIAKAYNNLSSDPSSFSKSAISYRAAISSEKYKEVYFILDFGNAKELIPFFAVPMNVYNYVSFPWIIIGKYSEGEVFENPISKIHLKLKGFKEEFNSVHSGINRFLYYLESSIKCELTCDINDKDHIFITSIGIEIAKEKHKDNIYCKKYKLRG